MPTTGWQAGGALFQACPALPGHLCPARPTITSSAATRLHQDRQCRRWRHHHHAAQQLPCASLHQHQQSGALHHHQACHLPPKLFHLQTGKGAWQPPSTAPWKGGETFCKHANLAPCHPASNGGATLLPSARSWQCISNANSCQLLPTLGNLRWSARKGEEQRP